MKRLLILVCLLGGCSSGPVLQHRFCAERLVFPMTLAIVDGQPYPTCYNSSKGEFFCEMKLANTPEMDMCSCKATCPCCKKTTR